MSASDWALLACLSVMWGGSFVLNGVAIRELHPLTIVAGRIVLGAIALNVILQIMRVPLPRSRAVWGTFLFMGIVNAALPFTLIVWGQTHIPSGLASILNATTPLFTALVAHVATRDERMNARKFTGVLAGFVGVAVMIGGSALQALSADVLGQVAVLGASICYAFSGVYGRRFKAMGVPPVAIAAGQMTTASIILLPVALIVDKPWTLPALSAHVVLAVLCLALVSSALAYIIYFRLLASAGATNTALVTFLVPVSTITMAAFMLDESLTVQQVMGMAMIAMGLLLIDGRIVTGARRFVQA